MRIGALRIVGAGHRVELAAAGVGLVVLLCVYFWPVALGGQALLPADLVYRDPVWQAQAPAGFVAPHNSLLLDQVYQFYPWRLLAQKELGQGRLPLWNPYEMAGTPLVANDQSAVFFPINLLLGWLPACLIPGWSAILRLLIAAWSMYALLRSWQASPVAGLLAGISFSLGGYVILWLGHPQTNTAIWLPLLILIGDQVLSTRRPWPWALLAAAVIGVQFLGGHAETSFFILFAWVLFVATAALMQWWPRMPRDGLALRVKTVSLRLRMQDRATGARLGLLALAAVLGGALAGAQLAPFLELLPQSNYYLGRAATAQHASLFYLGFWRDLMRLPTVFLPNLFGNPTRSDWWIGTAFMNYNSVLYMGILVLALAVAAGWLRRREWRPAFLAALALFSLAVIFRLPVFDWVRRLPLFRVAATSNGFAVVYCFCVAALAGLGLDALIAPGRTVVNGRRVSRLAHVLALFALAGGAGLAGTYLVLRAFKTPLIALGRRYVETVVYGKPPHPYPLEFYLGLLDERYQQLVGIFAPAHIILYIPLLFAAASALVLWALYRGRLRPGSARWVLLALATADLWAFGAGYNPTLPPAEVLPQTPALTWLAAHQGYGRSVGIGGILPANTSTAFGIFDVRAYDVVSGRFEVLSPITRDLAPAQTLTEAVQRFFDLAGVRYLLSAQPLQAAGIKLAYDREIKIYERPHPLPRAYLAGAYSVIPDEQALQTGLAANDVLSGQRVLLEEQPALAAAAVTGPVGGARILAYEPGAVTIATDSGQAALLVLSDAFYPGWKATVDGQATKIYRANFLFRVAVVPAGQHTVVFRYEPLSFQLGAGLSLGALAVLIAAGLWLWVAARQ